MTLKQESAIAAYESERRASGSGDDIGMSTRDWDATTYDAVSAPQQAWAREQLERLQLRGDEVVLDAGCGSGKVTAMLVELVPDGRVYAVDRRAVDGRAHAAGARRPGHRLCQDLTELSLPEQVDAIFSNATFHWIPDHPKLFGRWRRRSSRAASWSPNAAASATSTRFRVLADEVAGTRRVRRLLHRLEGAVELRARRYHRRAPERGGLRRR